MESLCRTLFPAGVAVVVATEDAASAPLLPSERPAVARAVEKRQREFAAGRWCARRAMERLGFPAVALPVGKDRAPQWPEGVVGSITHCAGFCGAAVASATKLRTLGFDVEPAGPLEPQLDDLVSTSAERERLGAWGLGAELTKALFSIKESVYKAYYPLAGRIIDFHDVEVELGPTPDTYSARLVRDEVPSADGRRHFEGRFQLTRGYVISACVIHADPANGE